MAVFAAFFAPKIRKIIIAAAAVLFAAGFTTSANAQQAEMQVYTNIGTVMAYNFDSGAFEPFDASGPIDEVIPALITHADILQNAAADYFHFLSDAPSLMGNRIENNLPFFLGTINRELQAGDIIWFREPGFANPMLEVSVRIYNEGGTDIFMAIGEETPVLATSVSPPQFFIRSDTGESTTTPHRMNFGYVAPDCSAANLRLQTDGLACRPTAETDCSATETFAGGICRPTTSADCSATETFANGMCRDTVESDCSATETLASGICRDTVESDCSATETFANGMCRPTAESDCSATETFAGGMCRTTTESDCTATETFANGICRDTLESDCTATETFANGICRDTVESDCSATQTFENGRCRTTTGTDCTDTEILANGICRAIVATDCTATETFEGGKCRATTSADCSATETFAGGLCRATTAADCSATETFASGICRATTAADCTDEVFSDGICQTPETFFAANTITVAATYTADSCESAGWISSITINGGKTEVAEVCGIPLMRTDTADDNLAASRSLQPQIANGGTADGCIIRQSAGFSATELPEECGHANVFGEGGFPQMPAGFNVANDRLIIAVNPDGNRYFYNSEEVFAFVPQTGGDSGTSQPRKLAYIGAGVFVVGAAAMFLSGGHFPDFNFTPDFGYSATESGYAAKAGGRLDFHKDNWHLYYSADSDFHRNGSLEFRYTSGGKYTADIWTATFSESVSGETADYDFSLSANLTGGIWNISPVYRLHSEYDNGETETENSLNLEGILRYNGWTIRPAAGFRWENADDFADNARFQINAIHRF